MLLAMYAIFFVYFVMERKEKKRKMSKKHTQTALFFLFLALYIAQMVYSMIFLHQCYAPLMRFLFKIKEDELFFAGVGPSIFALCGFFIWIFVSYVVLEWLFSALFGMGDYFKKMNSKENYSGGRYSLGSYKRDVTFCIIVEVIALFIFPFTFFYNIRVRDEGIIHKKFFSLHSDVIRWSEIESLSFNLKITDYKGGSATPQFIVSSGIDSIDLWNGFGLGSPTTEELIAFCDMLRERNVDAKIKITFTFSSENLRILQKYVKGESQVRAVYNYLSKFCS